jgi:four helix bundle protein
MIRRVTTNYKELIVWQKSIDLAVKIFKVTQKFPREELYGITSQLRRAAYSIPSNIAEGYCRGRRAEYKQFLQIAYGSAGELETQLIISFKTEMLLGSDFKLLNDLLLEVLKMLNRMILSLKL